MSRATLAIVLAACSSAPPAVEPTVETPRAPEGLVIAAARGVGPQGLVFELRADGTLIVEGESVGVLGVDGRFVATAGDVVAEVSPDGTMVARGRAVATIDFDGTATLTGGGTIRFDASGKVEWNRETVELRIEPADSPAKRALMMLVILLMV